MQGISRIIESHVQHAVLKSAVKAMSMCYLAGAVAVLIRNPFQYTSIMKCQILCKETHLLCAAIVANFRYCYACKGRHLQFCFLLLLWECEVCHTCFLLDLSNSLIIVDIFFVV